MCDRLAQRGLKQGDWMRLALASVRTGDLLCALGNNSYASVCVARVGMGQMVGVKTLEGD